MGLQHTTHAPHIHFGAVVAISEEALWGAVPSCGDVLRVGLLGLDAATRAEIRQLQTRVHVIAAFDEDVFRLQSMAVHAGLYMRGGGAQANAPCSARTLMSRWKTPLECIWSKARSAWKQYIFTSWLLRWFFLFLINSYRFMDMSSNTSARRPEHTTSTSGSSHHESTCRGYGCGRAIVKLPRQRVQSSASAGCLLTRGLVVQHFLQIHDVRVGHQAAQRLDFPQIVHLVYAFEFLLKGFVCNLTG